MMRQQYYHSMMLLKVCLEGTTVTPGVLFLRSDLHYDNALAVKMLSHGKSRSPILDAIYNYSGCCRIFNASIFILPFLLKITCFWGWNLF